MSTDDCNPSWCDSTLGYHRFIGHIIVQRRRNHTFLFDIKGTPDLPPGTYHARLEIVPCRGDRSDKSESGSGVSGDPTCKKKDMDQANRQRSGYLGEAVDDSILDCCRHRDGEAADYLYRVRSERRGGIRRAFRVLRDFFSKLLADSRSGG